MFFLRNRLPFLFSALGAFGALALAYGAEYGFDLKPCELCHYQRIVFYVILASACFFLLWAPPSALKKRTAGLLVLAFLFAGNMSLAGYQVLVEQKIVEAPKVCRASKANTLDELRAQLEKGPPVSCDKIAWSLFGISMAGFGGLYNLGFLAYLILSLQFVCRQQSACQRKNT
jgi:disulfide bond formation protein DsbB